MDKAFLRECISKEVDHWAIPGHVSVLRKIWFRYIQPESNAVYLIRKYQYYCSCKTRIAHILARLLESVLMRRYGIFIAEHCNIGLGFKIWHPHGIMINNVDIGTNFNVQHNCTIGRKTLGVGHPGTCPTIGNNFTMYANSIVVGPVEICDDVTLGANSLVNKSITEPGVYVGSPVRKV